MLNKNNIRFLLSKMTQDMHSNVKKIKGAFGSLDILMMIINQYYIF